MAIEITRYAATEREAWDEFVSKSRNGTFLLQRGFMDYHADRFSDHSLVMKDDTGVIALLPANVRDDVLHSHQGLTYGGLILGPRTGAAHMLTMVDALRQHLRSEGFSRLVYKTIPWIYHRQPSEDDRYALFRHDALLSRRDVLSVIFTEDRIKPQERRLRGAKAARRAGVNVRESTDFGPFWKVLEDNLRERYGVAPVHSVDEIALLHSRFPSCIRLFEAVLGEDVMAGVVIFETPQVAHVQYISASDIGKDLHALDLLFQTLVQETFAGKRYFDFGISNEDAGRVLNEGLVAQKEGFGARTVAHDYYELELA